MIKTILVDDHTLFRDGLEKLLIETGQFEIIQTYNSGKDLLQDGIDEQIHLLLLDIEMPEINGYDTIKKIRSLYPQLKIVAVSIHEEALYSNEAQLVGADAYLTKSMSGATLVELILRIIQGEKIFIDATKSTGSSSLISGKELQVLKLLSKGKSSKQISSELNIAPLSIKIYRRNLIRKLSATNAHELIVRALEKSTL